MEPNSITKSSAEDLSTSSGDPKEIFKKAEKEFERAREEDADRRAERAETRKYTEDAWRSLGLRALVTSQEEGGKDPNSELNIGKTDKLIQKFSSRIGRYRLETITTEQEAGPALSPEEGISKREKMAIEKMRKLIWENYLASTREYSALKKKKSDETLALQLLERNIRQNNPRGVTTRDPATDAIRGGIERAEQEIDTLAWTTPESYTIVKGFEFRDHIKELRAGKIITTPYVKANLDRVKEDIRECRPVFLHGHFGSGKTELAITAAREVAIERAALDEALEELDTICEENPDLPDSEIEATLGRLYRRRVEFHEKALRDGDKAAADKFTPLIISGSKDLTSQDLFTDKTLKLAKFDGKTVLEHKEEIDREFETWQRKHPEEAKDPEKAKKAADDILRIYISKNQAFGTEVETIEQAVYRGIVEGRPVIIDEINAIPSAVLMSMHNILQGHPGQSCYIPGADDPVIIKPGFSIIMTGNLSIGGVNYRGTEELNPAFLDRPDVIGHGYLPMSKDDPGYEQQANPMKNELFYTMITYLVDRQGNLRLPEMKLSLDKLFALSQMAREVCDVFEGRWRESDFKTDSGDESEPRLEGSALSIRSLLKILREWNKGATKDLDTALWDGFISNITNPDDQITILAIAQRYGFFQSSDGWNIKPKQYGSGLTTKSEAHPGPFDFERKPKETYSVHKVIEILYGPGPERAIYPDPLELDEIEELVDDELKIDDIEGFEKKLAIIDSSIRALEILGEQCGCKL